MKRWHLLLTLVSLFACSGAEVAHDEERDRELGSVEQSIVTQRTSPNDRISAVREFDGTGTYVPCPVPDDDVLCLVPATKTVRIMLITENADLRSWTGSLASTMQSQGNDSAYSGTNWSVQLVAAGQTVNGGGGVQVQNACNFIQDIEELPADDVRNFYTISPDVIQVLSEPTPIPGTYIKRANPGVVAVDGCKISTFVGSGSSTAYKNAYRHALAQGLYALAMGVGAWPSTNCSTCSSKVTLSTGTLRQNLNTWQRCLAKTLDVATSPTQISITGAAFTCPTPF